MQERNPIYLQKGGASLLHGSTEEINRQLFAILGSVYDGLFITDGNAVTILINQAYQTISGLNPEDVLGKNMRDIVASGLIDRSGTLIALETGKPATLEQTFRTGKQALITSTPCFSDKDKISMVITVVRDMTDLYGLQEKYHESEERRRSEMAFLQRSQQLTSQLIAQDPRTLDTLRRVQKVAALDTTILLLGETGVGKEQFARFIYENSARSGQSFIGINCGAIPPTLIESELFGYERGAFTGANREGKMGVFESANKGTVFLDEIGDLSLPVQVKLLRFIQERTFSRVGSNEEIKVDVRLITATSRNLEQLMEEGKFREDLYYRLNVFPIHLPSLHNRRSDIMLLAEHFLEKYKKIHGKEIVRISTPAINMLMSYHWPGNVRELENCIERAVLLSTDNVIHGYNLPPSLQTGESSGTAINPEMKADFNTMVESFERELIVEALKATNGNVAAAARKLGISQRIIHYKINKIGITPEWYKQDSQK